MRFSCGITLFNPKKQHLDKLIGYSKIFSELYIVDNTVSNTSPYLEEILKLPNVHLLSSGENLGLSAGLNLICDTSLGKDDFICLLDQDSDFKKTEIMKCFELIKSSNFDDVSIVAPTIKYKHLHHESSPPSNIDITSSVEFVITSGSFINLKLFNLIGKFDPNYFIDRIELDYCYRSINLGYRIMVHNNAILDQELGTFKSLGFISFYEHSPLRNYYQFRNRFYFYNFKYKGSDLLKFSKLYLASLRHVLKVLLLESKKIEKVKYILLAIKDYRRKKFGPIGRN